MGIMIIHNIQIIIQSNQMFQMAVLVNIGQVIWNFIYSTYCIQFTGIYKI